MLIPKNCSLNELVLKDICYLKFNRQAKAIVQKSAISTLASSSSQWQCSAHIKRTKVKQPYVAKKRLKYKSSRVEWVHILFEKPYSTINPSHFLCKLPNSEKFTLKSCTASFYQKKKRLIYCSKPGTEMQILLCPYIFIFAFFLKF